MYGLDWNSVFIAEHSCQGPHTLGRLSFSQYLVNGVSQFVESPGRSQVVPPESDGSQFAAANSFNRTPPTQSLR